MAVSKRMWENQQKRKQQARKRRARRRRNCLLLVILAVIVIITVVFIKNKPDKPSGDIVEKVEEVTAESVVQTTQTPIQNTEAEIVVNDKDFFNDSVFVGNAFIEGMDVFGMLDVADFYSGVTISLENVYNTSSDNETIAIIDQLKSKKFKKVFLAFGEQELAEGKSTNFAKLYGELIEKVKEYQPNSRIYVFAIPPATEGVYETDAYGINLKNINAYNRALKKLAMNEELYYIDTFRALVGSGKYLEEGISADGINLDKSSYAKILNYASSKAYIPDATDIANDTAEAKADEEAMSDEEEEDEAENETVSKTPTELAIEKEEASKKKSSSKASPKPTVNVLKESSAE